MTHKEIMKILNKFLDFSQEYRQKKAANTVSLKDEILWLDLYNKSMSAINKYDIDQIDFKKQGKSKI